MAAINADAPAIPQPLYASVAVGGEGLWGPFRKSLMTNAGKRALLWRDEVWSYADLAAAVVQRAAELSATGIGVGSRVVF